MPKTKAKRPEPVHVTLKVFGALRDMHRQSQESVALRDEHTVRGLLVSIHASSPELAQRIEAGLSDGYLSCLLNGRNVRFLQDLDTVLTDGDTVAFLPPIGGG